MSFDPNWVSAGAAVASALAAFASAVAARNAVKTAQESMKVTVAVELRSREHMVATQFADTFKEAGEVQTYVDRATEIISASGDDLPRRQDMLDYLGESDTKLANALATIKSFPAYHYGVRASSIDELVSPAAALRLISINMAIIKATILSWKLEGLRA